MIRALVRSGLAAALMASVAVPAARAQDEESMHFGTYEYASGRNSKGEIPAERLTGSVRVTEDRIYMLDADGREQNVISYTVDGEESPYRLSMKVEKHTNEDMVGATARALARHEGDGVRLIYDYSENADYPDDFEPEGQQNLFVLKKTGDE